MDKCKLLLEVKKLFAWHFSHSSLMVMSLQIPFGVRAEATADNTSIRVSWEWSPQGVLMCVDLVRVGYLPEGGSLVFKEESLSLQC